MAAAAAHVVCVGGSSAAVFPTAKQAWAAVEAGHPCPLVLPAADVTAAEALVVLFSGAPRVVYTDGSSLGNGRSGAAAGFGVYHGHPTHPKNCFGPVTPGQPPTNNVAELLAVERVCDQEEEAEEAAAAASALVVATDSTYVIEMLERRKWRAVENRDLIQRLRARLDRLPHIKFVYVPAHRGHAGNEAADALAKLGAAEHRRLGPSC